MVSSFDIPGRPRRPPVAPLFLCSLVFNKNLCDRAFRSTEHTREPAAGRLLRELKCAGR